MPHKIHLYLSMLLLVFVFAYSCKNENKAAKASSDQDIRKVKTIKARSAVQGQSVALTAVARAAAKTPLSFRIGGKILEIAVSMGQSLDKNQIIARLDDTDLRLNRQKQKHLISRTEAEMMEARADYRRIRQLYQQGHSPKSNLDQAKARYMALKSSLQAARKTLALLERKIEYSVLRSPYAGKVLSVPAEPHQVVQKGQVVAILQPEGKMEISTSVPDKFINKLQIGQKAKITFEAIPDKEFIAHIIELGIETGPATTYPVRLSLEQTEPYIKAGMIGQIVFTFISGREKAVIIPAQCVMGGASGEKFVWILQKRQSIVQKRQVQIESLVPGGMKIKSGLKPGDIVVSRGMHRLDQGMQVRAVQEEEQ